MVLVSLPATNHDPALTPDGDVLDVTRGAAGYLAFGREVHHSISAPQARTEMRIAFPALLRRFPRPTAGRRTRRSRAADLRHSPRHNPPASTDGISYG
jgi:cytochrome P450